MTIHIAYREFSVMDGATEISAGEIRYCFKVKPGREAVTWANASGGFSPGEAAEVDVTEVAIRFHEQHPWRVLTGIAEDAFIADVPAMWFMQQIEDDAE